MPLVMRTRSLKVTNKGGGIRQKVVQGELGWKVVSQKVEGSDYVTFYCPFPGCEHRNKQCVYKADMRTDGSLSFKCTMCLRIVEVIKPPMAVGLTLTPDRSLIISPLEFAKEQNQHASR